VNLLSRNFIQNVSKVIELKEAPWPTEVTCEMNIEAWKEALIEHGLLPEYQDVIDGFRFGFDQGIPQHRVGTLTHYTPDNHSSSEKVKSKVEDSIKKELVAKRMFGPFSLEKVIEMFGFCRSNPLGAVVNGDGAIRPINDLSFPRNDPEITSVNSFVDKSEFETTWDDFRIVSEFFAKDNRKMELALFDWEKAYRQIPTRKEQWRYLMVKDFNGNFLIDTRITFGGVAGCGSFGRPADAWKLVMKSHFKLLNIFRWVDDNLFVRLQGEDISMDDVVDKSHHLGVLTNKTKYSPFQDEQKFIGFIWNGVEKTVRLPDGKLETRLNQIKPFLEDKAMFDYNDAEILVGRLNHVAYILPHLRCRLCSLYQWLMSWKFCKALRPTPSDVLEDLKIWTETLNNFEHTRIINYGPPVDVGWVGHASTSFGIGILIGKHWAQFKLHEPSSSGLRISYLETVAIRLGLLMLLKLRDQQGKTLVVWTDNTTTENGINNKKSRDRKANSEWVKIQTILVSKGIELLAKRVTSKDNRADALSRGIRSGQSVKYQVVIEIPVDLQTILSQVVFII
jgi:hypothetical protein